MAFGWDDAVMAGLQLYGMMRGNGGDASPTDEERELQQEAIKMLQLQKKRTSLQNPLYEAVTRMAMGLLPTSQQRDIPTMYWDLPTAAGGPTLPPPTRPPTHHDDPTTTDDSSADGFNDPAARVGKQDPSVQFANGTVYDDILRQNRRLMGR